LPAGPVFYAFQLSADEAKHAFLRFQENRFLGARGLLKSSKTCSVRAAFLPFYHFDIAPTAVEVEAGGKEDATAERERRCVSGL
jgi:hypothetical protein